MTLAVRWSMRTVLLMLVLWVAYAADLGTEAAAQDDVLAVVSAGDGSTELVLLRHEVVFRFSDRGARQIERRMIGGPEAVDAAWADRTIRASAVAGIRGMRMAFPVAEVRDVRFTDGSLILHFTSRPADADPTDQRGLFEYQEVSEAQAVHFIEAFRSISVER